MSSNALTKLQSENLRKLPQKRAPIFAFFYKTRANTQQVLPVQTGLYQYDEWMSQDINDKNLNGS